jgi:SAM-dependent methyltransferase
VTGSLVERLRQRFYPEPGPRNPFELYYEEAALALSPILDFGAGRNSGGKRLAPRRAQVVGIDPDRQIKHNDLIDARVVSDGTRLPFRDGHFGLCVMRWVVEHLADPQATFREVSRVLRSGGRVIILTSNLLFYGYVIAKLIPNRAHGRLVRVLYGRSERDTFPTRYRANTPGTLRSALQHAGFRQRRLTGFQRGPGYLGFSAPTFLIGAAYDYIVNLSPKLQWLRQGLIAEFEKAT